METADLYRLMEDPSLLSEGTLPKLEKLIEAYPYFSTARLLYLKNLAIAKDIRLEEEVNKMAVYLPDRRKLFRLLEGEKYGLNIRFQEDEKDAKEDAFSLIDAFLSSSADPALDQAEASAASKLLFHPSASSDYIHWSLSASQEKDAEADVSPKLQHQDLIDSFLQEDQQKTITGLNRPAGKEQKKNPALENTLPEEKKELPVSAPGEAKTPLPVKELDDLHPKSLDDSYFTETLARIYVKQKRYEKALQIIKNLSLKYPEKNVYFADQIRFLEKLIINTKK